MKYLSFNLGISSTGCRRRLSFSFIYFRDSQANHMHRWLCKLLAHRVHELMIYENKIAFVC